MNATREFRRLTFGRRLDVKRLKATLSRTMKELSKNLPPEATAARVEGIIMEADRTTVFVSGNDTGLASLATALRTGNPDVTVSNASREDVLRAPDFLRSKTDRPSRPSP